MCYSAIIKQNAKKLGLRYDARVQFDIYLGLVVRRLAGEKIAMNLAVDEQFLGEPSSAAEIRIKKAIVDYHLKKVNDNEQTLFSQQKRLADAERKLEDKEIKKALEDRRIATNKIAHAKKYRKAYQAQTHWRS